MRQCANGSSNIGQCGTFHFKDTLKLYIIFHMKELIDLSFNYNWLPLRKMHYRQILSHLIGHVKSKSFKWLNCHPVLLLMIR